MKTHSEGESFVIFRSGYQAYYPPLVRVLACYVRRGRVDTDLLDADVDIDLGVLWVAATFVVEFKIGLVSPFPAELRLIF